MIRYEWDPAKADANLTKHGVRFEVAEQAIRDPLALSVPDPHPDGDRWRTIGRPQAANSLLLFVVHTEEVWLNGELIGRIISARLVTQQERRSYEGG